MKLPKDLQNKKKRKKGSLSLKMDEEAIKKEFPIHNIIDELTKMPIPCPKCLKTDFLRGWDVNGRRFALCYFCGAVFTVDDGEIIHKNEGDRMYWGARALAIIGTQQRNEK